MEIGNRVAHLIRLGTIDSVDQTGSAPLLQIQKSPYEIHPGIPHFQHFGFASIPLKSAEVLTVQQSGDNNKSVSVATRDLSVPGWNGMLPGDSKIYDNGGDSIWLSQGKIYVVATTEVIVTAPTVNIVASSSVNITSPTVNMSGNLVVQGNITDTAASQSHTLANLRSAYDSHIHTGVQTGNGNTSIPNIQD